MPKIYKAIGICLSAIAISPICSQIESVWAATINFEIDFFDNDSRQVGSGTFSFNEGSSTCIEPFGGNNFCNPSNEFEDVIFTNVLNNFEADITVSFADRNANSQWNNDYTYWWNDEETGQNPGGIAPSSDRLNPGFLTTDNSWFFGDPFIFTTGGQTLDMSFDSSSDTLATGDWDIYIFPNSEEAERIFGFDPIFNSGTFEARQVGATPENPNPIPEPFSILGLFSTVGLGYLVKRKTT